MPDSLFHNNVRGAAPAPRAIRCHIPANKSPATLDGIVLAAMHREHVAARRRVHHGEVALHGSFEGG
jgi:hypothetical protein